MICDPINIPINNNSIKNFYALDNYAHVLVSGIIQQYTVYTRSMSPV